MRAYVIVDIEITDPAEFEKYRTMVAPTIAQFGGRYVARGGRTEVLEGQWKPKRLVILEFDSVERAKEWWSSQEYAPAKELRLRAAKTNMVIVEGIG